MKIEIELPYEIGEELYWLHKEKIVKTKVSRYVSFNLGTTNLIKIDMADPNSSMTVMLELNKVFRTKEDLIKAISE